MDELIVECMSEKPHAMEWSLLEGIALCTAIQNLPSQKFHCHPALTGGLLYKQGPRKDCDIVIYQRGDVNGKREPIDWPGLWAALEGIGLRLIQDYGYVKKCLYQGKPVDVFDPTQGGGNYGQTQAADAAVAEIATLIPADDAEGPEVSDQTPKEVSTCVGNPCICVERLAVMANPDCPIHGMTT